MKVFGHHTLTDILPGRNLPHITGRNGDFSTKEYKISISDYKCFVDIFTQYSHIFKPLLIKKINKRSKII